MEEELKMSNEILRKVLGRRDFQELLDLTSNILDKKIGKGNNIVDKIIITNVINKFIVNIGYFLSEEKTLIDFDEMCNPIYKEFIHFDSIQEIYKTYKKYIAKIVDYYINNQQ